MQYKLGFDYVKDKMWNYTNTSVLNWKNVKKSIEYEITKFKSLCQMTMLRYVWIKGINLYQSLNNKFDLLVINKNQKKIYFSLFKSVIKIF